MRINTNIAAMGANRNLNISELKNKKTMEKLSSGFRINRAADDASGFSVSQKMRSQINGLNKASKNVSDGLNLINVGEGCLAEICDILHRMKELTIQAGNDTNEASDRSYIQGEIDQLCEAIDDISEYTEFNGVSLLNRNDVTELSKVFTTDTDVYNIDIPEKTISYTRSIANYPKDNPPAEITRSLISTTTSTTTNYGYSYDEYTKFLGAAGDIGGTYQSELSRVEDWKEIYTYHEEIVNTISTTELQRETYYTLEKLDVEPALAEPVDCVDPNGFPRFVTETNSFGGSINLYCALTRAELRMGGTVYNLYNYPSVQTTDGSNVKNVYTIANSVQITQNVDLVNDAYVVSFDIKNIAVPPKDIDFDFKFSMDAMNTTNSSVVGSGAGSAGILKTNDAQVTMTSDSSKIVYGDIDDLISSFDLAPSDSFGTDQHTGVSYYWEGSPLGTGESITGQMTYEVEFLADYYEVTVETIEKGETEVTKISETTDCYLVPPQLAIHSGANENQVHTIRLFDVSTSALCIDNLDVSNGNNCGITLQKLDDALTKVTSYRGDFGARYNGLEHTKAYNDLAELNATESESRISDTNMAEESMELARTNILSQASTAMLAQANSRPEMVLQLLQ